MAPLPLRTVTRYAYRRLDVLEHPHLPGSKRAQVEANTPTLVVDAAPSRLAASAYVIADGRVIGKVPASQLVEMRPTADGVLLLCRAELAGGSYGRALLCAEDAVSLRPKDPDASRLLAALLEAAGEYQEARRVRSRIPASTPAALPEPTAEQAPEIGARLVVAASLLSVRQRPDAKAPVLHKLLAGTPVDVLEVDVDWVRVRFAPSPVLRVAVDPFGVGSRPELAPPGPPATEGWVGRRFLAATMDAATLRAAAERLIAHDASREAVPLLERVLALQRATCYRRW